MSPLESEFGPWGPREKTPEEAMAELCILLGMGTERSAYSEVHERGTRYMDLDALIGGATYEPPRGWRHVIACLKAGWRR